MKLSLLLTLLITLSCAKKAPEESKTTEVRDFIMEIAPSTIFVESENGVSQGVVSDNSTNIEFGDVLVNSRSKKRITIQAKSDINNLDISGFVNAQTFTFKKTNCGSILKKLRSCVIDMELNPQTNAGSLTENIEFGNGSFNLVANITQPSSEPQPPTSSATGRILTIQSQINLGDYYGMTSSAKLTVYNPTKVPMTVSISPSAFENSEFSYTSYCPTQLNFSSCQVEINYTSSAILTNDLIKSTALNVNGISIPIQVTHKSELVSSLVLPTKPSATAVTLTEPQTTKSIVKFKNLTSSRFGGTVSAISSSPGLVITSFNCASGLPSKRVCTVAYTLNSLALPLGSSTQTIKLITSNLTSATYQVPVTININTTAQSGSSGGSAPVVINNETGKVELVPEAPAAGTPEAVLQSTYPVPPNIELPQDLSCSPGSFYSPETSTCEIDNMTLNVTFNDEYLSKTMKPLEIYRNGAICEDDCLDSFKLGDVAKIVLKSDTFTNIKDFVITGNRGNQQTKKDEVSFTFIDDNINVVINLVVGSSLDDEKPPTPAPVIGSSGQVASIRCYEFTDAMILNAAVKTQSNTEIPSHILSAPTPEEADESIVNANLNPTYHGFIRKDETILQCYNFSQSINPPSTSLSCLQRLQIAQISNTTLCDTKDYDSVSGTQNSAPVPGINLCTSFGIGCGGVKIDVPSSVRDAAESVTSYVNNVTKVKTCMPSITCKLPKCSVKCKRWSCRLKCSGGGCTVKTCVNLNDVGRAVNDIGKNLTNVAKAVQACTNGGNNLCGSSFAALQNVYNAIAVIHSQTIGKLNISEVPKGFGNVVDSIKVIHDQAVNVAANAHTIAVTAAKNAHTVAVQSVAVAHDATVEAAASAHSVAVSNIATIHGQTVDAIAVAHDQSVDQIAAAHTAAVNKIAEENQTVLNALSNTFNAVLVGTSDVISTAWAAAKTIYEDSAPLVEQTFQNVANTTKIAFQNTVNQSLIAYQQSLEEAKKIYKNAVVEIAVLNEQAANAIVDTKEAATIAYNQAVAAIAVASEQLADGSGVLYQQTLNSLGDLYQNSINSIDILHDQTVNTMTGISSGQNEFLNDITNKNNLFNTVLGNIYNTTEGLVDSVHDNLVREIAIANAKVAKSISNIKLRCNTEYGLCGMKISDDFICTNLKMCIGGVVGGNQASSTQWNLSFTYSNPVLAQQLDAPMVFKNGELCSGSCLGTFRKDDVAIVFIDTNGPFINNLSANVAFLPYQFINGVAFIFENKDTNIHVTLSNNPDPLNLDSTDWNASTLTTQTRACSAQPAYSAGGYESSNDNFQTVSSCTSFTCTDGAIYSSVTNSCNPVGCTVANAGIEFATAVAGTIQTGCYPTSCSAGYEPSGLSAGATCVAKACSSSMTSSEILSMQISTSNSNGSLSGTTYPNCTLAQNACNSGYRLINGDKACDLITVATLERSVLDYVILAPSAGVSASGSGVGLSNSSSSGLPVVLGGNSASGSGSSPSGSGAAANNPAAFLQTDATASSLTIKGQTNKAISICDLDNITATNCEISGSTFTQSIAVADLQDKNEAIVLLNEISVNVPIARQSIQQVSNINSSGNDAPSQFRIFNNELYFSARSAVGSSKLHKISTNGTIVQVSNTRNNNTISTENDGIVYPTVFGNELYFHATNAANTAKLMKMSSAGVITQLSNITSSSRNDYPYGLTVFNSTFYFVSLSDEGNNNKLFKINNNEILQVSNIRGNGLDDGIGNLTVAPNYLFFSAKDTSGFNKIFRMDASENIVQMSNIRISANDINSNGSGFGATASLIVVYNNDIYFPGFTSGGLNKLFKMTNNGVITQVSNIRSASNDNPLNLTVFNNELYFSALNSANQTKLFKVNSSGVITQLSNLRSGNDSPSNLLVHNNELYFSALNSAGQTKLFKINSTGVITQVSNINPSGNDTPTNLHVFNNELYFSALNSAGQTKLFKLGPVAQ